MASNVSAFLHIEIVHSDPEAAGVFMSEVFGAERVDENLAEYVVELLPGSKVVHMMMGNVIFQFVKPTEGLSTWTEQLANSGPGVHNISIQVDDLEATRSRMVARGCKEENAFTIDMRKAGLKSTGPCQAYIIDAFQQAGMRFEMMPTEMRYATTLASSAPSHDV